MPVRSSAPSRAIVALVLGCALLFSLAACATGAPKSQPPGSPSTSASTSSTSSAPSTAPPTPESTSPAPTTSAAPTPANQPAVVYLKSVASSAVGEPVDVTVRVETPNPGVPFGDVTLLVNGASYASATLDAEGNATFSVQGLPAGSHTFTGSYAGNLEYVAAQSSDKAITVMTAEEIAAAEAAAEKKKQEEAAAAEKKKQEEAAAAASGNPCPASARACVDLTNNKTWIQEGGQIIYGPVPQIAGREGYRTPPGMFYVGWKNIDHKSSEFNNAPMPYAIFFNGGIAFHQGSTDTPSHGCIRLEKPDAQAYWDLLDVGDAVYVFGQATTY
ncbi:L,D-transpeptidase family protein [Epidermidibacterium keratini]|uniref:L,D-transpeptidase family protein n=1 Tax=Epidermidibacterium keratini TaxID=1891644 RepID=A0A7L4YMF2_9ACTN|nr:Ig-like domain repeat protein [Epidermidibacterium keratini]QHC00455.1 L,D-transpeptidase family protein [Epidermidibacterium keratini]